MPILTEWHGLQAGRFFVFHFESGKTVIGIPMASVVVGVGGWILFRIWRPKRPRLSPLPTGEHPVPDSP